MLIDSFSQILFIISKIILSFGDSKLTVTQALFKIFIVDDNELQIQIIGYLFI